MLIGIDPKIIERYPQVEIGYLTAQVKISKTDPFVEQLKESLQEHFNNKRLLPTNYVLHPTLQLWRKIYEEDFAVKAKTYQSSVEALLRRVMINKGLWNICNVVDLYNCCSLLSLLPMGGYDLDKIHEEIKIRYAQQEEKFLALGAKESIPTMPHHVVYADDKNILCWLWNHKDCAQTCIDSESKSVIFFIDGFHHQEVLTALQQLSENLQHIQCLPMESGILNRSTPHVSLNIESKL